MKNLTGVIAGSQFKYDLVSKARVVQAIVRNKATVEKIAKDIRVKELTVKMWVARYGKDSCYEAFLDLPAGVMQVYKYAFKDDAINSAIDLMETHFDESLKLKHTLGFHTGFGCTGGVDWQAAK